MKLGLLSSASSLKMTMAERPRISCGSQLNAKFATSIESEPIFSW